MDIVKTEKDNDLVKRVVISYLLLTTFKEMTHYVMEGLVLNVIKSNLMILDYNITISEKVLLSI